MVISRGWSDDGGLVGSEVEQEGSAEVMVRLSLVPLSSRGRLRVREESASSIESRRGGDGGTVIAWSSAGTDSIRSLSC